MDRFGNFKSFITLSFLFYTFCVFLSGCASSAVTRETTSQVDLGYQHTQYLINNAGGETLADTFGNSSQRTKGMLIGGTTGAVVGGLTTGVGILPGAAEGMIIGGAYGTYIDQNTTLQDRLENRGVNVIMLGDQLRIVLLSDRLFNGMTANIRPEAYSTLYMVADLIRPFIKMSVQVAAYTNVTGSARINLALSREQAESVAKFLWASGINSRLLYAVGRGGTNLVTENSMQWSGSDNYRIEITLEQLPA